MANDECSEERQCLNKTEFAELIPHLSVDDWKLIEYYIDKWSFLIKNCEDTNYSYTCNLCSINVKSASNLNEHLGGNMHGKKMTTVKELYHPDYTYFKKINNTSVESKPRGKISIVPMTRLMKNAGQEACEKTSDHQKIGEKRGHSPNHFDGNKKMKLVVNPAAKVKPVQTRITSGSSSIACNKKTILPKKVEEPIFTNKNIIVLNTDKTQALIGVEYVIKIVKGPGDPSPMFECALCEIVSNELAMQSHLVGYKHRLKYCTKHFPTAIKHYQKLTNGLPDDCSHRIMLPVLEKLSFEIQKHHGRELPYEVSENSYESNRDSVHCKVYSFRHASERLGPSFLNVMATSEINQLKARAINAAKKLAVSEPRAVTQESIIQNYIIPCPTNTINISKPVDFPVDLQSEIHCAPMPFQDFSPLDDDIHKAMVEKFLRQTSGGRNKSTDGLVRSMTNEKKQHSSRYEPVPNNQKRTNRNVKYHQEDSYDSFIKKKMIELNKRYAFYRKNPEQHPLYNIEWQDFWKKCKSKLISEGVDHVSYDYQPKWIHFFKERIEELYYEERNSIKLQAKQKFPLDDTDKSITIETNMSKRTVFEKPVPGKKQLVDNEPIICDTTFSVVSVLRFLTALEEQLGSLGPKIVELLSKALQVEKINPTKINSIILTNVNCTILETAMEKFKGLLVAGLLDSPKERALKKAIVDVERILKLAEKERKENDDLLLIKDTSFNTNKHSNNLAIPKEQPITEKNQKKETTTPSVVTKTATSDSIDTSQAVLSLQEVLKSKGHTDIDANHLQQFVSVYALMEKKKKQAEAKSAQQVQEQQKRLSDTLQSMLASSLTSNNSNQPNIFNNNSRVVGQPFPSSFGSLNSSSSQNATNIIGARSAGNNSMSNQSQGYNMQQSNYNNNSSLRNNFNNNAMSNSFMNHNNLLQYNNKNMLNNNSLQNNNSAMYNNNSHNKHSQNNSNTNNYSNRNRQYNYDSNKNNYKRH